MNFKTVPAAPSVGQAVVLGCNRGPCWLWGSCQNHGVARAGPVVTMIGSARDTEYERLVVVRMCKERPQSCSFFSTGPRENSTSFVQGRIADMYQVIMASTFCLNPPGDTPTRKGLFDSLVLGCIPVVTSEDSFQHYGFHLPFWRSVSVLVTTDQLFSVGFNLVDFLIDYETKQTSEVAQKQEAIRQAAYSLQYSYSPAVATMRGPDAFDRTLEHLMARPVSQKNHNDFIGDYSIVNVATGMRLADKWGKFTLEVGEAVVSHDSKWRILGKGDGTCCYTFQNIATNRAFFADVNATDAVKFGLTDLWRNAEQKWRLTALSHGNYAIINVKSGRRLFATIHNTLGAALLNDGDAGQNWNLIKVR